MTVLNFLQKYKIEICIFVLALAVRLIFLGLSYEAHDRNLINTINAGDGYYEIAQNIIAGHGYSSAHEPPYTLTSYRTPVTSYFIAGTHFLFDSYFAVILVQIMIGSIIPLLGMRIARYITDVRGICIATGIFLALEPTGILLSILLLSEIPFAFVFSLSIICLFSYWTTKSLAPLLASAFLLGVSTLTRPTVEYLPLIIIALILWEARTQLSRTVFLRAGLYVLIFIVTLSPWLYRNYHEFGVLGLSSQQGTQLYTVTVPSVLAIENGTSFAQEYNSTIAGPNEANFAQSAEYSKLAMPILLNHPRSLALMSLSTAFRFFTYDGIYDVLMDVNLDSGMYTTLSQAKQKSGILPGDSMLLAFFFKPVAMMKYIAAIAITPLALVFVGRTLWLLLTVAFFAGIWRYWRLERQKIFAITVASIVSYLMLTTLAVGFTTNYRYRLPVNVFIVAFAAYAALPLVARLRHRHDL